MSPIRSWSDGYAALRKRASDTRGWIELDTDAPDRRWPRTTGLDVILIASFIDTAISRAGSLTSAGTALRWTSCKDDIERDALHGLGQTYRGNRGFWSCLAAMCSHLALIGFPLPPQAVWSALLAEVGVPLTAPRNAPAGQDRPPVWFANVGSLEKLYLAQRTYLANLHGADKLDPEPDMTGGAMLIPRSTNGEVIQIAKFWTQSLDNEKAKNAPGYDTVRARWTAAQRDLDTYASGKDPALVYPKNHAFWRHAATVAVHVGAAMQHGMTDAQMWMASVGETIQAAAERTKALATSIAASVRDGAADVVEGAGKVINKGARGLFGGLATPLLIGGGVLTAFLLLRSRGGGASHEGR
jgi:hypothetical protein